MRTILLVAMLLLVSFIQKASAQVLAKKLKLQEKELTGLQLVEQIKTQTGAEITFDEATNKRLPNKVRIRKAEALVREVLDWMKADMGVLYQEKSNYIILSLPRQTRISGAVLDAEGKKPLPGVSVKVKDAATGTATDDNGNFSIPVNETGAILVFSYIGYQTHQQHVSAADASITVTLNNTNGSKTLSEVTVQARRSARTDVSVLNERKRSHVVQDAISAQQIERTGSITTTQALQRVAGVTVTDDKYVAIRGLGDRSVIGQLNGVRLASSDPDRSTIPLDLVPASLLDNITIYKTMTPDKPADAAAGIVELKTKSIPDSLIVEVVAQTGFNSNIGVGGNYNSFWNSEMGFLGNQISKKKLSTGFKNLAQEYPDGVASIHKMIANSNFSTEAYKEVNRINGIMQGFDPVLTTQYRKAPLNQLYSATFGNSYNVFRRHKIGLILGGNYYSRTTDIYDGELTRYSIYQGVVTGNSDVYSPRNIPNYITPNNLQMGKYLTYKENTGIRTINYGVLAGFTYRFSPLHEISIQYLGSWGGETQATRLAGQYEYTGLPGTVANTTYSLRQTFRTLHTFNLQGEHKFTAGKYAPRLSYNFASSRSTQEDPDYRFVSLSDYMPRGGGFYRNNTEAFVYTKHLYALNSGYVNGFGSFGIIQAEPNGRRWRNLDEKNYNYKADLTFPFPFLGQLQELKMGVNYLFRERNFAENQLFLPGSNFSGRGAVTLYDVEGDLNRLVGNSVIGVKLPTASQNEGVMPIGGFLYNSLKSPNNYNGYFTTNAFYGMMVLKLTNSLRLAGGVRFEMTDIGSAVDTSGLFLDPKLTAPNPDGSVIPVAITQPNSVYKTGYKPYYSVNAIYNLNNNMNFRAAFNTALARPELREITNVFEFDAFQMGLVVGNPNLRNQLSKNLDFRWEWFPNLGEVLAVSAFGKQIENQLVKVFDLKTDGLAATYPEFPTIQFQNDPNTGTVWGIELEVVKDLGKIWKPLRYFFLGSNLLLAQSNIKKSTERYEANRSLDRYTPKNSPLFEQAPYSINAWLNYNNKKWGTDLTTTFNMVGERLIQINLTGEPDLYTRPVALLDIVFSQKLTKKLLFKGYAKNILNPSIKTVYANPGTGGKWYGKEYINRSYKRGSEIMMGFTYNLF